MIIRLAELSDLKSIIAIEGICFSKLEAASGKDIATRFATFMNCFMVAEEDDKVIGFINGCCHYAPELIDKLYHDPCLHDENGAFQTIFGLCVLPCYREQGVAQQLLQSFIHLTKERKKKGMVLTCKDGLVHYYEKFGFEHQGVSSSNHGGVKWNDMLLIF